MTSGFNLSDYDAPRYFDFNNLDQTDGKAEEYFANHRSSLSFGYDSSPTFNKAHSTPFVSGETSVLSKHRRKYNTSASIRKEKGIVPHRLITQSPATKKRKDGRYFQAGDDDELPTTSSLNAPKEVQPQSATTPSQTRALRRSLSMLTIQKTPLKNSPSLKRSNSVSGSEKERTPRAECRLPISTVSTKFPRKLMDLPNFNSDPYKNFDYQNTLRKPIVSKAKTIAEHKVLTVPEPFNLLTSKRKRHDDCKTCFEKYLTGKTSQNVYSVRERKPVKGRRVLKETVRKAMKPNTKFFGDAERFTGFLGDATSKKTRSTSEGDIRCVNKTLAKPLKNKTKPTPFSFQGRNEEWLANRDIKLKELEKRLYSRPVFKAQDLPSPSADELPARKRIPKTVPKPFHLLIDERGLMYSDKLKEKVTEETLKWKLESQFKAKPCVVTSKDSFQIKKPPKHDLGVNPFHFLSEDRAVKRRDFEDQLKEKQMILDEKRKEAEAERLKQEKEEDKALRARLVHKPEPVNGN